MNAVSLEKKVITLVQRSSWLDALRVTQEFIDAASGEALGGALSLKANVLWLQSVSHVRASLALIDQALPLLAANQVQIAKALMNGCQMAEVSLDVERHRSYARQIRDVLAAPTELLTPWIGRLMLNLGYYWETTGNNPGRAVAAFRDSAVFYDNHGGPYDQRDCGCQQRYARSALGDTLLKLGRRMEAGEQYRLARTIRRTGDEGDAGRSTVAYLDGRLAAIDGRIADAVAAYGEGIQLAAKHGQDHRGLLRLSEALAGICHEQGDRKAVRAIVSPLIAEFIEAGIPQVALRLQQLAMPCSGEEAIS